jgi:hypothetical protein
MTTFESLYPYGEPESAQLIQTLFTPEYWEANDAQPGIIKTPKLPLSATELKLAAATFEKGVSRAMKGGISPVELPQDVSLDLDRYAIGTLMLIDVETIRQGIITASGSRVEYDMNYPGQLRRLINSDAQDLIDLYSAKQLDRQYVPTRFHISRGINGWQYSRLAWFGMVAPAKDSSRSLLSFESVDPDRPKRDLFQHTFSLQAELFQPAVIGATTEGLVKDNIGNKVQQYQRLRAVSVYKKPADWLSERVGDKYYSTKNLGRRAIRNLSGACLVGDSE